MSEYYEHPGYSSVDHQLDPLMDAIRQLADPTAWMPGSLEFALAGIDAVEAAMRALRRHLRGEERYRRLEAMPPCANPRCGHSRMAHEGGGCGGGTVDGQWQRCTAGGRGAYGCTRYVAAAPAEAAQPNG